jgi:hypothetical protein
MSKNIRNVLFILISINMFSGCGNEDNNEVGGNFERLVVDDDPISCLGFGLTNINVFVKDSLNDDLVIDSAQVTIHTHGTSGFSVQPVGSELPTLDQQFEAIYVSGEDGNSYSEQNAYYANLDTNSLEFDFGIVVHEPNYHSFVTKNLEFKTETSCGADNGISYTVYLCPIGTTCI